MNQLNDVEDKATKLKIYKNLLSNVVNDPEVIALLEDYIKTLEPEESSKPTSEDSTTEGGGVTPEAEEESNLNIDLNELGMQEAVEEKEEKPTEILNETKEDEVSVDSYLPSPFELGIDCLNKQ